ncbi:hypothetical protein TruAng_008583 [Truncatella angustata]|nr:hypothetical protein TruAng_008583 [Truncatella angustata]
MTFVIFLLQKSLDANTHAQIIMPFALAMFCSKSVPNLGKCSIARDLWASVTNKLRRIQLFPVTVVVRLVDMFRAAKQARDHKRRMRIIDRMLKAASCLSTSPEPLPFSAFMTLAEDALSLAKFPPGLSTKKHAEAVLQVKALLDRWAVAFVASLWTHGHGKESLGGFLHELRHGDGLGPPGKHGGRHGSVIFLERKFLLAEQNFRWECEETANSGGARNTYNKELAQYGDMGRLNAIPE